MRGCRSQASQRRQDSGMQLFPAFTTMNRFTDRVRTRRIAALVTYKYPSPEQASVYDELEAIGDQLDAEVGYFHTAIHDPRTLPAELKHRLGSGLLVPWPPPSKVAFRYWVGGVL